MCIKLTEKKKMYILLTLFIALILLLSFFIIAGFFRVHFNPFEISEYHNMNISTSEDYESNEIQISLNNNFWLPQCMLILSFKAENEIDFYIFDLEQRAINSENLYDNYDDEITRYIYKAIGDEYNHECIELSIERNTTEFYVYVDDKNNPTATHIEYNLNFVIIPDPVLNLCFLFADYIIILIIVIFILLYGREFAHPEERIENLAYDEFSFQQDELFQNDFLIDYREELLDEYFTVYILKKHELYRAAIIKMCSIIEILIIFWGIQKTNENPRDNNLQKGTFTDNRPQLYKMLEYIINHGIKDYPEIGNGNTWRTVQDLFRQARNTVHLNNVLIWKNNLDDNDFNNLEPKFNKILKLFQEMEMQND
ncbi:MAG: hypothetical protein GF364_05480 [Candidatus Lokiarchaeota archaeon]|nr:hypothetical protein [Candidatus Lokiarchaeota archaeon]